MKFLSTRDKSLSVDSSYAILNGISKEGGLFVPESIPKLTKDEFEKLKVLSYKDRAKYILKKYLTDFSDEDMEYCANGAYIGSFDDDNPAPISQLGKNTNVLELWHGPTCAFKDLALQILPFLLTTSSKMQNNKKEIVILVATSGDTGKAALEGFKNVPGTKIIVFYPEDGVSPMQKLQMNSQEGENVSVYAVKGNFDDAQSGVKKIFTDKAVQELLDKNGMQFSSANSINFGRLAPQIVYYISVYLDLLNKGDDLSSGFNVVVPTGNFGNILAAYYAKEMGVPINKLICASNSNNILTDFINTGVYDKNRSFYTTVSPSMDILISSNLERMLYHLSGDDKYIANLQNQLFAAGKYEVNDEIKTKMQEIFFADYCSEEETFSAIHDTFSEYGYLSDTHTAVAIGVYKKYLEKTGDNRPVVIASTASPYKFSKSVLKALGISDTEDEFKAVEELSTYTNTQVPKPIAKLYNAKTRFKEVYEKEDLLKAVEKALNI
ncbi:MAG: threonine synthase [Clostridia bacterium]|nr:threonine synthase [Clostridia bacterium]